MVDESEVRRVAGLADIRIPDDELPTFTARFNRILEYFDVLDTLEGEGAAERHAAHGPARGRALPVPAAGGGPRQRAGR